MNVKSLAYRRPAIGGVLTDRTTAQPSRARPLRWGRLLLPLIFPACVLVAWQVTASEGWLAAQVLPPPSMVMSTFVDLVRDGEIAGNLRISLWRIASGFAIGGAIRFGFGVSIGGFFAPWGWAAGGIRFDWGGHAVFLNNARWGRTWVNRGAYVHPYTAVRRPAPGAPRPAEAHALHTRSEPERNAPRQGRAMPREGHREERR